MTEWTRGKQDGTLIVKRNRRRYACYADLPYIIHKDFKKLVRLVHMFNRTLDINAKRFDMLRKQCQRLHERIYGTYCSYTTRVICVYDFPVYVKGNGYITAEKYFKEVAESGIGYCKYCGCIDCYADCAH